MSEAANNQEIKQPTVKERLAELTSGIEKGIQELFQSEKYQSYLRTMSRFHRYSLNNTMLIYLQKPDATLVAGFNKWRDQFTRNVMKGEKGIRIIAPMPYKKTVDTERIDPATRQPVLGADGQPLMDQKEITIPLFRPVSVFDVSQTAGKPLPEIVHDLTGSVEQYEVFLEALKRSAPVPIEVGDTPPNVDGLFSENMGKIVLRPGMSEVQTISTAVHELAHAKLHTKELLAAASEDAPKPKDRMTREVEAESVAYAVCAYYGIATEDNSFGYIATWSQDKELTQLKESLETINRTASDIITGIDHQMVLIRKERGLDNSLEDKDGAQQEQALSAPEPPDTAMPVNALEAFGYTDQDMHPLSRERAMELFDRGLPVHLLGEGNVKTLATRVEEITNHTGICGISKSDWAQATVRDVAKPLDKSPEERFNENPHNAYLVFQMREGEELRDLRFQPYSQVQDKLNPTQYEAVQTGTLPQAEDTQASLNKLYVMLNEPLPWDKHARSLSMGDVLALKQDGQITCHYVDKWGYVELPGFLSGKNPLRSLEDSVEQNDNQLDGIINNTPAPREPGPPKEARLPATAEQPRKSVLEQIRKPATPEAAAKAQRQMQQLQR